MMISFSDTLGGDRARAGARTTRLLSWLDAQLVRRADVIVADTQANADWIAAAFPRARGRVIVVSVGAEPERFPPRPQPESTRPGGVRGQARAVARAGRRAGGGPIPGGAADPDHRRRAAARVARRRARPQPPARARIRSVGPVRALWATSSRPPTSVWGSSAAARKAGRVIPNKVWQAMAVGRPIITADTPGAREVLRDGYDALLVPVGDARALAGALARLADDPELRARARRPGSGALRAVRRAGTGRRPVHRRHRIASAGFGARICAMIIPIASARERNGVRSEMWMTRDGDRRRHTVRTPTTW